MDLGAARMADDLSRSATLAMTERPTPKPGLSRLSTSPGPVSPMTIASSPSCMAAVTLSSPSCLGVGVHHGVRSGLGHRESHVGDPFGIHSAVLRYARHLAAEHADSQWRAGNLALNAMAIGWAYPRGRRDRPRGGWH